VSRPDRLEVGRIGRPHGLTGEVVVTLLSDRPERVRPGARLEVDRDAGPRVLVVRTARPHRDRWLIRFEGVDDREAAEALRGTVLYGAPIHDPGVLWAHELVGSELRDTAGRVHGTVTALQANPASDLLVLGDGRLVPLRFVVEQRPGVVIVEVPAGLLDEER